MRTNLVLLGIVASTWAVTAQAQPPGPRGDGPPHNPIIDALDADGDREITFAEIDEAAEMLKEQDVNGDKKLTGDEVTDIPGFGGGPGGPGPGRPGRGGPGPRRGGPRDGGRRGDGGGMAERLMGFDKNEDGKLAADEVPGRMQRLIKGADTDGDGSVDKDELAAFAAKRSGERDSGSSAEGREDGDRRGRGAERRGPEGRGPEGRGPRGRGPGGFGGRGDRGPGGPGGPGGHHGPPSPERMVEHAFEFDANHDGQLSKEEMTAFAKELGKRRRGPGGRPGRGGEDGRPERPRRPERE